MTKHDIEDWSFLHLTKPLKETDSTQALKSAWSPRLWDSLTTNLSEKSLSPTEPLWSSTYQVAQAFPKITKPAIWPLYQEDQGTNSKESE